MKAFVWRSGRIGLGRRVPGDALLVAEGPPRRLRQAVGVCARLAYDGGYLVPGLPESESDAEAGQVLVAFIAQVSRRMREANHA